MAPIRTASCLRRAILSLLNNAHLVIVNGLGLEESLESILDGLDSNVAVVSVNAGIDTLAGAQEMDDHEGEVIMKKAPSTKTKRKRTMTRTKPMMAKAKVRSITTPVRNITITEPWAAHVVQRPSR